MLFLEKPREIDWCCGCSVHEAVGVVLAIKGDTGGFKEVSSPDIATSLFSLGKYGHHPFVCVFLCVHICTRVLQKSFAGATSAAAVCCMLLVIASLQSSASTGLTQPRSLAGTTSAGPPVQRMRSKPSSPHLCWTCGTFRQLPSPTPYRTCWVGCMHVSSGHVASPPGSTSLTSSASLFSLLLTDLCMRHLCSICEAASFAMSSPQWPRC